MGIKRLEAFGRSACSVGQAFGTLYGNIFAIRPEHIRVQKDGCDKSISGMVSDYVFRGAYYVEYLVAVGEMSVRARMPMPAPMFLHCKQVYVKFPKEYLFEVQN